MQIRKEKIKTREMTKIFNHIEYCNSEFEDCTSVIDYVGRQFVEMNYATENYFECIKKEMVESDSYMVIVPHIVLLHSSPKNGALTDAFHFMKLSKSVKFNHKCNDPVNTIITFTATDSGKHIESIKSIAYMLMDEDTMARISQASTTEEITQAILGFENSNKITS